MDYLLSIVIPTKNRAMYCESAVRSILAYEESIQLVVQDSSDDDELEQRLKHVTDTRLVYKKVSSKINMTENFDTALMLATGNYVLMLGDDDGISPKIFEAIQACVNKNASSMASREFYASYNWPDFRSKYSGMSQAGKLNINLTFDSTIKEIRLKDELSRFLNNGGQGCMGLPKIYHGLVSQKLIQKIREKYGACFFGVSPDVSFAFLAAIHSERHLLANYPITISGASGGSNAGRSALRTHKGELSSDPHMEHYKNVVWPSTVPAFFSVESVWAQAATTAVALAGDAYYKKFDFCYLYALMHLRHPNERVRINESINAHIVSNNLNVVAIWAKIISIMIKIASADLKAIGKKILSRFIRLENKTLDAINIEMASKLLRRTLET